MGTVSNIKIEPMVATWGESVTQIETITCVADVAGSLNNKYFFIYDTSGVKYHVWFNVNSAGTDPAPGGSTAEVVALATGATANTVATAVASVIDGLAAFVSTASSAVVTVTAAAAGFAQASHEGSGSGFSFSVTTEGDAAADVGFVEGDIEITMSENKEAIKANETGSNVLSEIRHGKKVEVKLMLLETSVAQLQRVLRQGGGAFTPAGANATQLVGWGQNKDFTQTILNAKKLSLHPKVLGASDKSRDMTFHLAYIEMEKLSYSGEKTFNVPLKLICYPKTSLKNQITYFSFGDASQTLT